MYIPLMNFESANSKGIAVLHPLLQKKICNKESSGILSLTNVLWHNFGKLKLMQGHILMLLVFRVTQDSRHFLKFVGALQLFPLQHSLSVT